VMPATVQVEFKDGSNKRIRLPVETWIQKTVTTLYLVSTQPIVSVTIES